MILRPETAGASGGSFRDPSGRVFARDGRLFRHIDASYAGEYRHLRDSGLYQRLVDEQLLVPHEERVDGGQLARDAFLVIEPERIPFISYPFEWSFSELKAAALATLRIHRLALDCDMALKDASAFNIQYRGTEPVLIDTLSFERWQEGTPWIAYRQFCQHFLGPLTLMSRTDVRLGLLSRVFIDGPPLDLVSRLLPAGSWLSPSLLVHLHFHARVQRRHGDRALSRKTPTAFGRRSMLGLVDHLRSAIDGLSCRRSRSRWTDYYGQTNYSPEAMAHKEEIVGAMLERERPSTVWDLGANTGAFSRIASTRGAYTIAFDSDHDAVERHFVECRRRTERCILPLVMDLTNPTGGMGWNHAERQPLVDRGPADAVLALGLIHHLSLANQVPFAMAAAFLQRLGRSLIIEFPSRADSQVQAMLSRMPRLDSSYTVEAFERAFAEYFTLVEWVPVTGSARTIYLMRAKPPFAEAGPHEA